MLEMANIDVAIAYFHNKGAMVRYCSPNSSCIINSGNTKHANTITADIKAIYPTYLNKTEAVSFPSFCS